MQSRSSGICSWTYSPQQWLYSPRKTSREFDAVICDKDAVVSAVLFLPVPITPPTTGSLWEYFSGEFSITSISADRFLILSGSVILLEEYLFRLTGRPPHVLLI